MNKQYSIIVHGFALSFLRVNSEIITRAGKSQFHYIVKSTEPAGELNDRYIVTLEFIKATKNSLIKLQEANLNAGQIKQNKSIEHQSIERRFSDHRKKMEQEQYAQISKHIHMGIQENTYGFEKGREA